MTDDDRERRLAWAHGEATLQRLGAMLAPVCFRAPGRPDFQPMQVAPWADEPGAAAWPGILRRLRGEWPCVPFGRTDRPDGLGDDWAARDPGDDHGHGYASNHDWQWQASDDPLALVLTVEPPPGTPLKRLTRTVRAVADAPALELTLAIDVDAPCTLPVALHPTLRLDLGEAELELPHAGPVVAYPVPAEPGVSRLAPGRVFADLRAAPRVDGGTLDLTRFPLPVDTEELLQVTAVGGPVRLHHRGVGWALQLDWDRRLLPDAMLWVSHRGRRHAPWNGRHLALGIEPVNGVFDLGRVAEPPAGHALAARRGLALQPGAPTLLRYRIAGLPT